MKKFILLFYAIASVTVAQSYAQLKDNYIKGILTLADGNEINGYIKLLDLEKMNKQVYYKPALTDENESVYPSKGISRISLENGSVYDLLTVAAPRNKNKVTVLASLLLRGKASLYETSYNQTDIYIVVNNGETYWLQNDEIAEGKLVNYYFKNMLYVALKGISENEAMAVSFDNKSLIEIVSKYNRSLGEVNEVVSIKKEKTSFIIVGGGGMYLKDTDNEFYLNAVYRTYFPAISQNTSFNVGLSYFRRVYEDDLLEYGDLGVIKKLYTIPVFLQQNLLNKRVRPYVYVGLNASYMEAESKEMQISVVQKGFQKNFGIAFLLGGGIEADVLKKLLIKAEYRYENFSHLIMPGIAYKFQL